MKQDETGWGSAPPAENWHCPECGFRSPVAAWERGPSAQDLACPSCAHCAHLDTRACPHCGYEYTAGPRADGRTVGFHDTGTSGRLSAADAPGHVKRDGAAFESTSRGLPCARCHPDGIPGMPAPGQAGAVA